MNSHKPPVGGDAVDYLSAWSTASPLFFFSLVYAFMVRPARRLKHTRIIRDEEKKVGRKINGFSKR